MTTKKRDKRRYVRIVIDGTRCTMPPSEALESLVEDVSTVEDVWLTQAEYEALPEFAGW